MGTTAVRADHRRPRLAAACPPRRRHHAHWRARHILAHCSSGGPPPGVQGGQAAAAGGAALAAAPPGALLQATLGDGSTLWLEVVRSRPAAATLLVQCQAELLELRLGAGGAGAAAPAGVWPRARDAWVARLPGLSAALDAQRRTAAAGGGPPPPSALVARAGVAALAGAGSLAALKAAVAANPAPWCDGAGAGDPDPSPLDVALLTAGELVAFLRGRRGVVLVQLHVGWEQPGSHPLLRPHALRLLARAAGRRDVVAAASRAGGGRATSLVLAARRQPFRAWGAHLAAVGVQAGLVADSPYYKLLVGRALGYREANIVHHVEASGGRVDARVAAAVDAELRALSGAAPALPWCG